MDTGDSARRAKAATVKDGVAIYCARGASVFTHTHEWLELAYLEKGNLLHTVDSQTVTISEGEYFIIEPGQAHSYVSVPRQSISLMNVLFMPQLIDPMLSDASRLRDICNHYLIHFPEERMDKIPSRMKFADPNGSVGRQIRAIYEEVEQKRIGWRESVRGLLIYIIIHMLRNICSSDVPQSSLTFAQPIIEFVQNQYMKPVRIGDVFGEKKYSTAYLSRQFHQETGMTFSAFLKHTRIEASCRLLVNTDQSIAAISENVGYHDTTFFHNTFRSLIGMSPLEYRREYRKRRSGEDVLANLPTHFARP